MPTPSIEELGERLGIVLRDPTAVRLAFVHSSYSNENPQLVPGHNERLEFLGDAVVGLVVSRLLFERYPNEDEGFLTTRRASLVNRDALASMALELGLDRYLLLVDAELLDNDLLEPVVGTCTTLGHRQAPPPDDLETLPRTPFTRRRAASPA